MTPHLRLSALLHALLLLCVLTFPVTQGGDGPDNGQAQAGSRSEEPLDVTIVAPPSEEAPAASDDAAMAALKKIAPHAGDTCERFYGGIGIMEGVDGVTDVYPGYPAHKAGIQPGDVITSNEPIRGEVGTPVTVEVLRGMRRLTFELVRDKICVA